MRGANARTEYTYDVFYARVFHYLLKYGTCTTENSMRTNETQGSPPGKDHSEGALPGVRTLHVSAHTMPLLFRNIVVLPCELWCNLSS